MPQTEQRSAALYFVFGASMAIKSFPDVSSADESGLLAVGGDLEVPSLLLAYRSGIFPWPLWGDRVLPWFAPPRRAVMFFDKFHVPRRLARKIRRGGYSIVIDTSFDKVIRLCAASPTREEERGTWITPKMIRAYTALHLAGFCHSLECVKAGKSLGGLYGVAIGNMFAGESMYHLETDGSKICLCLLVNYLRERGLSWIDCQQMTPLFALFGAEEIERREFMKLLDFAVKQDVKLF